MEIPIELKEKIVPDLHVMVTALSTEWGIYDRPESFYECEARYQVFEGARYHFALSKEGCVLSTDPLSVETSGIITNFPGRRCDGLIEPNIYVGTLQLFVLDARVEGPSRILGEFSLEVQSVKTNYRSDYRQMIRDIAEYSADLLMRHTSPVKQMFEVDYEHDSRSMYQQFAFVKGFIDSHEFDEAIHRVLSTPVTRWKTVEVSRDLRSVKRIGRKVLQQFASSANQSPFPARNNVKTSLQSVPSRVYTADKTESVDSPANQFVKYALKSFSNVCRHILSDHNFGGRLHREASSLDEKLELYINDATFDEVSDLSVLPLNNPVLLRKEGYREILRTWLAMNQAAALTWAGGDHVYGANKKDVATLYEYWVFFMLLEAVQEHFKLEYQGIEELINVSNGVHHLNLEKGKALTVRGVLTGACRSFQVKFCYNRSFVSAKIYPEGGSWTQTMRPDYTVSIWPDGIDEQIAENMESIVHVHFDAKYKVDLSKFHEEVDLDTEHIEQRKGIYRRADLLKMHAYKDAIRRTAGAYVIYPGQAGNPYLRRGFHEIVPGLGAFPLSPTANQSETGLLSIKSFIGEIIVHLQSKLSQRERLAQWTYFIHKDRPIS